VLLPLYRDVVGRFDDKGTRQGQGMICLLLEPGRTAPHCAAPRRASAENDKLSLRDLVIPVCAITHICPLHFDRVEQAKLVCTPAVPQPLGTAARSPAKY